MEFRELKTFQAVASFQSFNKAASVLNYAQSTVSSQIQSLENSLGEALFIRSGNKISLTPAGTKLMAYTQRLINLEKEILSSFKGIKEKQGSLTIKTPQSISAFYFPTLIQEFQMLFPKIGFDIDWCTSFNLNDIFNSGAIDLAFLITDDFSDKSLEVEELAKINLALVVNADNEILNKRSVSVRDLDETTLILAKSDCNYRRILRKMTIALDIQFNKVIDINSIDAIKQLLLSGNGIALLPDIVVKEELNKGIMKTLNWKGPAFNAKLFMIWNRDSLQTEPLSAFMLMVRKMF